jgi:hypothetical protein
VLQKRGEATGGGLWHRALREMMFATFSCGMKGVEIHQGMCQEERERGVVEERARGGSTTPESMEDDGDICGLWLRNSVTWQCVLRRGKERRERRTRGVLMRLRCGRCSLWKEWGEWGSCRGGCG